MALNIEAFGMGDQFADNARRVFDEMRASDPLPGHDAVRLPGDGKGAAYQERQDKGLTLNPALLRDLDALASEYGIDSLQ